MDDYTWSDSSAMWQVMHGDPESERTESALAYLETRLAEGVTPTDSE